LGRKNFEGKKDRKINNKVLVLSRIKGGKAKTWGGNLLGEGGIRLRKKGGAGNGQRGKVGEKKKAETKPARKKRRRKGKMKGRGTGGKGQKKKKRKGGKSQAAVGV